MSPTTGERGIALFVLCLLAVGAGTTAMGMDTTAVAQVGGGTLTGTTTGTQTVTDGTSDGCTQLSLSDGEPTYIEQPGCYTVPSVVDATASPGIVISASDVVLDGQGAVIDGTDNETLVTTTGTQQSNVTVRNLDLRDWETGIRLGTVEGATVEDIRARGGSNAAISLEDATNTVVRNVTVDASASVGIGVFGGSGNAILQSAVERGEGAGVVLERTGGAAVSNVSVTDTDIGLDLRSVGGVQVRALNVSGSGLGVGVSAGETGVTETILRNVTAYDVEFGAFVTRGGSAATPTNVIVEDLGLTPTTNVTVVGSREVAVDGVEGSPPATPDNAVSLNRYLGVAANSSDAYLDVRIPYDRTGDIGVGAEYLRVGQYNGSWQPVRGTNRPVLETDTVRVNVTDGYFGTLGLFGTADTTLIEPTSATPESTVSHRLVTLYANMAGNGQQNTVSARFDPAVAGNITVTDAQISGFVRDGNYSVGNATVRDLDEDLAGETVSVPVSAADPGQYLVEVALNVSIDYPANSTGAVPVTRRISDANRGFVGPDPWANISVTTGGSGGGSTQRPVQSVPDISVSPTTVGFGDVARNRSVTETVTVRNSGTASLDVTGLELSGSDAFEVTSGPTTVGPGGTTTVTVSFTPTEFGATQGTLSIRSSDPSNPEASVSLTGIGVESDLAFNATALSFGAAPVGETRTETVGLSNTGTEPLLIENVAVTGRNASAFAVTDAPDEIAAGSSASVTVSFTPDSGGRAAASLSVETGTGTSGVALNGTGAVPNLTVAPGPVSVGSAPVGGVATADITLGNDGGAPLGVSGVTATGSDATAFGVRSGAVTVPPDGQTTVTVTFAPTAPGPASGTLEIQSDDPDGPATVAVEGVGEQGTLGVTPLRLDLGVTTPGSPVEGTVTVRNNGTAPAALGNATLTGGQGQFALTEFTATTLRPGDATTATVAFDPRVAGNATATLRVPTNRSAIPTVISRVRGTGDAPDVRVRPRSVNFVNATVGETSERVVTVTNAGTTPLTVEGVSVRGSDAFTAPASAPLTVAAGGSATLPVAFTPNSTAPVSGTLALTTDDPDEPYVPVYLTSENTTVRVNVTENRTTRTVEATATNPDPDRPVAIDVDRSDGTDDVALTGLTIDVATGEDFTLDSVSQSDAPAGSPEFGPQEREATEPLQYLDIDASVPNSDIDAASVEVRVAKDRIGELETTDPEDIAIYRHGETEYVERDTEMVRETEDYVYYRASADGFSEWTVGAKQARFEVLRAAVGVETVTVGDSVNVVVRITNTGGADGDFLAELLLNEDVVNSREVFIAANGTSQVTFDRLFGQAGTYSIRVNNVSAGQVEVESGTGTATTDTETSSGFGGPPISPVVALLAVVTVAAVVGYRLRKT